jgi:PAS domain-containing protein
VVENFDGGILLEDITGKIEFINDNFIKIFKIKQSKSSLKLSNSEYLVNLIKSSFLNANQFYETIGEIIKSRSVTTGIEFKTLDDRIIEINHFPIQYEKNIVNHLWIIRNITDRRLFEKKLKNQISELERFNKAMIDREIRMIELKKEVNELLNKMGLPAKYQILE